MVAMGSEHLRVPVASFALPNPLAVTLPHWSTSNLGQHVFAKPAHVGRDRVGGVAAEAEIHGNDAKLPQRAQIGRDCGIIAGAEPPLSVVGALGNILAELREPVGELQLVDVAPARLSDA